MTQTPPVTVPVRPPQPSDLPTPPALPVAQMQRKPVSLFEAIIAASSHFGDIVKDSKNDYLKSDYLSLPGLLAAVKPALLEHGIMIYSQIALSDGAWAVRTTLALVNGNEELSSDFPIPDLSNQQRIGSAVTYGTRYNLFAMLAISPGRDDDGNSDAFPGIAPSQALPGLPGNSYQQQPAQMPVHPQMYQQPPAQFVQQPGPVPLAMTNPVQPLPVLQ